MLKAPFETKYPRWRHRTRGYRVEILEIVSGKGDTGYFSQVLIIRLDNKRRAAWSAEVFKLEFKPSGRKVKPASKTEALFDPLF